MTKHPRMAQYLEKVCKQLKAFQTYILTQVLRVDNVHTDALADLGSTLDHQFKHSISMEYLDKPSIEAKPTTEVSQVSITPNWQSSIIQYLVNDMLPTARKIGVYEAPNQGNMLLYVERHSHPKILH
ncbi:hypothetical protein ACFX2A_014731 [Malus domestica]